MNPSDRIFSVPAQKVDASGDWLFWAQPPDEAFCRSVAQLGQLEPVLIARDREGPRLLAGYKRLLACRELGREVLALSVGSPHPVARGRIYAESNRQLRPADSDLVRAGRYFARHLEKNDLEQVLRELAGPQSGRRRPRLVHSWLRLDRQWDEMLEEGHLPLRAALILAGLDRDDAAALMPFFRKLRWSQNNALQFISWLQEAATRQGCGLDQLIRSAGLRQVLEQDLSPRDSVRSLVQKAREVRYPELTRLEKEFISLAREATASGLWRIDPEGTFESDRIRISASIGSSEELQQAIRELEELLNRGFLDRIRQWQNSHLRG